MTPQAKRDAFVHGLVEWLNRRVAPAGVEIEADTRLFAGGLVNSMRIMELIAWTERAIGREIPDAMIRMDNFQTADRIAEVFLMENRHVDV